MYSCGESRCYIKVLYRDAVVDGCWSLLLVRGRLSGRASTARLHRIELLLVVFDSIVSTHSLHQHSSPTLTACRQSLAGVDINDPSGGSTLDGVAYREVQLCKSAWRSACGNWIYHSTAANRTVAAYNKVGVIERGVDRPRAEYSIGTAQVTLQGHAFLSGAGQPRASRASISGVSGQHCTTMKGVKVLCYRPNIHCGYHLYDICGAR